MDWSSFWFFTCGRPDDIISEEQHQRCIPKSALSKPSIFYISARDDLPCEPTDDDVSQKSRRSSVESIFSEPGDTGVEDSLPRLDLEIGGVPAPSRASWREHRNAMEANMSRAQRGDDQCSLSEAGSRPGAVAHEVDSCLLKDMPLKLDISELSRQRSASCLSAISLSKSQGLVRETSNQLHRQNSNLSGKSRKSFRRDMESLSDLLDVDWACKSIATRVVCVNDPEKAAQINHLYKRQQRMSFETIDMDYDSDWLIKSRGSASCRTVDSITVSHTASRPNMVVCSQSRIKTSLMSIGQISEPLMAFRRSTIRSNRFPSCSFRDEGMSPFDGLWHLHSIEGNVDALMVETGVPWALRALAKSLNYGVNHSEQEVRLHENKVTIVNRAGPRTNRTVLTLGAADEETVGLDGKSCLSKAYWDGSVMVVESKTLDGKPLPSCRRYLRGENLVVEATTPHGIVVRRHYCPLG